MNTDSLAAGDASKLAGKLSWGCASLFHRMGRAMLRPIFDQQTRRDGAMNNELRRALGWWKDVLQTGLCEKRKWERDRRPTAHLFCDASGSGGMGAVLLLDERHWHTALDAPTEIVRCFQSRSDNQIMGLELLAISLGLSTFGRWLQGRSVVVHCDNTGAEVSSSTSRMYGSLRSIYMPGCMPPWHG